MLITLVLVIGVIFVFLRNASATIIPSMALPFALLGTFAVMAVLSYSLDQLSLMALILSIGFVVDDAIVMLENIMRHIERGEEPFEAALKGSREIGFTIISMTVSLAAVFIPGAVHGRHPGTPVPRIRGDHYHGDSGFRSGVHHLDAHAVQPVSEGPRAGDGASLVAGRGMVLPADPEVLRLELARRSAMASGDADPVLRGFGAYRLPV